MWWTFKKPYSAHSFLHISEKVTINTNEILKFQCQCMCNVITPIPRFAKCLRHLVGDIDPFTDFFIIYKENFCFLLEGTCWLRAVRAANGAGSRRGRTSCCPATRRSTGDGEELVLKAVNSIRLEFDLKRWKKWIADFWNWVTITYRH